jgi:hypothetical protein
MTLSVYEYVLADGGLIYNHESDLYIEATDQYIALCRQRGVNFSFFTCEITGKRMIEIPFGYAPHFDKLRNRK